MDVVPVAWWRVFDQRLHADVARQRTVRGFAAPPLQDARGARRRWPEDLYAISASDVCAHAAYVREADNAELGDVVKARVDAFIRGRADGTVVEHDPRIAVRTVRAGPRPYNAREHGRRRKRPRLGADKGTLRRTCTHQGPDWPGRRLCARGTGAAHGPVRVRRPGQDATTGACVPLDDGKGGQAAVS